MRRITLPTTQGKRITAGNYTGVGFDLCSRCAPVVNLTGIVVRAVTPRGSR